MRRLGLAIAATFAREGIDRTVVGRDVRSSSEPFFKAIADGLSKGGVHIIDIGVVPTPVLYFAARKWNIKGGVMITASHNPPEFNGFKVIRGEGTIYGDDIRELHTVMGHDLYSEGQGTIETKDAVTEYIDYLTENLDIARPVGFAADGGNGTTGIVFSRLFSKLGQEPVELFMEPDGSFPNHHPDPTVEKNLADLKNAVLEKGLELGIGFDGDSDRIGIIDEKGEVLWGDRLLALFSRDVIARNPGTAVIFEVKCSQSLEEDITRSGGRPIMWKTGHSLIKKKMRDEKALLAGEMSGHIFFADRYFGFDDAIYAACRLLELISRSDRSLSRMLEDLPKYESTPEIRLACEDERKFDVVREIRDHFKKTNSVIDVDGARVRFDNGWGLVRASNTQPVLVLRFEARSKEAMKSIRQTMADVLGRYIDVSGLFEE